MICFSGNKDSQHKHHGVAVIVSNRMTQSVINFPPVSDRILLLKMDTETPNIIIIKMKVEKEETSPILRDFPSTLGKEGKSGKYIGEYGLKLRNDRVNRTLQFFQEHHDMIVSNTFFKVTKRIQRIHDLPSTQ